MNTNLQEFFSNQELVFHFRLFNSFHLVPKIFSFLFCRIPLKIRMVTAAVVMIAMFILTVALVKINTDSCEYSVRMISAMGHVSCEI